MVEHFLLIFKIILMTDSCCSMTEISATLQSNYHSIKNKNKVRGKNKIQK